jgi:pimeloyl-ACP methyl ester carboxylesterase
MAELIPGSALEKIRFAAHLPQLERPQRINQVLERFLLPERKVNWRPDSMEGDVVA